MDLPVFTCARCGNVIADSSKVFFVSGLMEDAFYAVFHSGCFTRIPESSQEGQLYGPRPDAAVTLSKWISSGWPDKKTGPKNRACISVR